MEIKQITSFAYAYSSAENRHGDGGRKQASYDGCFTDNSRSKEPSQIK